MLISLSPLGNLSRYIRRTEQVRVHETALLLVDGTSLSCSGAILAARSRVLERVLEQDYEIVLEGFEGMIPQINQVCRRFCFVEQREQCLFPFVKMTTVLFFFI